MAATVRAFAATGAGPTNTLIDSVGGTALIFGTDDAVQSAAAVNIPTAAGTIYSWLKNLMLATTDTVASGTTISNRKISMAGAPTAGFTLHWKANTGAYAQASGANMPAANGTTNDAVPATYTQMTTTPAVYDATGVAGGSVNPTKNGAYCLVVLGVSNLYTGGANANAALPNLVFTYDESG